MRLSPFAFLAGAAALVRGQSLDENYVTTKKPTVFNDVTVPPLLELTPLNFEEEVTKTKYLMVKHYRYATSRSQGLSAWAHLPVKLTVLKSARTAVTVSTMLLPSRPPTNSTTPLTPKVLPMRVSWNTTTFGSA